MGVCRHCGLKEEIFPFPITFYGMRIGPFLPRYSQTIAKSHPSIGCRGGAFIGGDVYWGFYGNLYAENVIIMVFFNYFQWLRLI